MKNLKYIVFSALAVAGLSACQEDHDFPVTDIGPEMKIVSCDQSAYMGGKVNFSVSLKDPVPLSTLKAELLFDEDVVGETTIRTRENGTYDGSIDVPYYKNIPDGDATMRFYGQNIHFGMTTSEQTVKVSRPDFPNLIFVLDGTEYDMARQSKYNYAVTAAFPPQAKGYIRTPEMTGCESMTFGWSNGEIGVGTTDVIPFSSLSGGEYTISFNTLTFTGDPFMKILLNGKEMAMIDEEHYRVTTSLTQGEAITIEGIDLAEYWIDRDYFELQPDGTLKFMPLGGTYGITIDLKYKWIIAEVYAGGTTAVLGSDGSGAIWVIGDGIGKPSLGNTVGWTTEKGLCMAPIAPGKFRISGIGGITLKANDINFKFFHQKGWGGEFGADKLTCASDLVFVGDGQGATDEKPKRDNGNLGLYVDKSFEMGSIYEFTVDVTGGIDNAVLTVEKVGEQELPSVDVIFGGVKLDQIDADNYEGIVPLEQGAAVAVSGIDSPAEWWFDTNYFTPTPDGKLTMLAVSGTYKVKANMAAKLMSISRVNADGSDVTTADDGTGGLWMMAWGLGYPSLDEQFAWNPGAAYCMAEISPAVYRLTGTAGPEHGSKRGDYFRFDYVSAKYFFQNGWGGEMKAPTLAPGTEALLQDKGNLELAEGVNLEEGATYELTIDLTAGKDNGVVTLVKK